MSLKAVYVWKVSNAMWLLYLVIMLPMKSAFCIPFTAYKERLQEYEDLRIKAISRAFYIRDYEYRDIHSIPAPPHCPSRCGPVKESNAALIIDYDTRLKDLEQTDEKMKEKSHVKYKRKRNQRRW